MVIRPSTEAKLPRYGNTCCLQQFPGRPDNVIRLHLRCRTGSKPDPTGALWGFYPIMSIVTSSMSFELVPLQCMGRWNGVLGVFAGLVTVPAPLVAGLVWRHVGPAYVFIIPISLDLALRIPLLTTIPETLWKQEL